MRAYLKRLSRPWKLLSFHGVMLTFAWAATHFDLPTWDRGVILLMSGLCFTLDPLAMDLCISSVQQGALRPMRLLAGVALIYLVGSGSYQLYNVILLGRHPETFWENFAFSIPVTITAGLLWRYDGSLMDLARDVRRALGRHRP